MMAKQYKHFIVVPHGPGVTESIEIGTLCSQGWTVASAIPMDSYVSILLEREAPEKAN